MRRHRLAVLTVFLLSVLAGGALAAPPKGKKETGPGKGTKTKFVRITRVKDEPVAMETSIVSYVGRDAKGREVRVDLVGVVHVAEKSYYQQLNKEFEKYDVVLYELVAPKGVVPKRGMAGTWSPLARMLKLSDQILWVDYEKKNFVHADMSGTELWKSMEKRNESFMAMFFRAIGQGIAQQSDPKAGTSEGDFLAALLFEKDPAMAWKRVMAPQFEDLEASMGWLSGPEGQGSTLISERNKVALEVLRKQLDKGRCHVAVFYGAGHLPDMEKRLIKDFQLKRDKQRWLVAWYLTGDKKLIKKAER